MTSTKQRKDQILRAYAEEYVDVRNSSGSTINAYTLVKITGDYSNDLIPSVSAVSSITDTPTALLSSPLLTDTNTSHPSSTTRALRRGRIQIIGFDTTGSFVESPVYFTSSGTLTLTGGSPQIGVVLSLESNGVVYIDIPLYFTAAPESFSSVGSNTTLATRTIEITGGTSFTLPAAGNVGRSYRVINASMNTIIITSTSQIGNKSTGNPTSLYLRQREWLDVYDTGTQWRII